MSWVPAVVEAVGNVASTAFGAHNQAGANATNVRMQKAQQQWEANMSNTAIQRRKADIEAAGGNPALAFTNGSEATTPSVSAAHVDPYKPDSPHFGTAMLLSQQMDNLKAQTQNTTAQTRKTNIESGILENIGGPQSAADLEKTQKQNALFDQQLRKSIADADISETTAKLLKDKSGAVVDLIRSQATLGELDAQSAQHITDLLGIQGKDASWATKMILEAAKMLFNSRSGPR